MRIAFDYQVFGFQPYGGVSRYFYELSRELALSPGNQVAIIAPLYVNRYLPHPPQNVHLMGISVPALPKTPRFYRAANPMLAWPALRSFRPDIVHETYYSSRRLAPANAKVVLTVYDMIHERFPGQYSKRDSTRRDKALSVARADHVICISEQTRKDVLDILNADPSRVSVIHLGFNLMNRAKEALDDAPHRRPFLLYVGQRDGYKNFEGLLHAYASSSSLHTEFDVVCFGGGKFSSAEESTFQRLALSDRIRHIAGDDSVLAKVYSSARAFLYPSLYEGFGIPPLEAMSFDCPVVCSNTSSLPEVVADAAEMFDPSDVDSMRGAIERVAGDDARRDVLIARGRERIKQFSWERCAKETMDVYSKVMQ